MKALDLFCGQGGAARGLAAAGYEATGIDLVAQPRYPYPFIQADALVVLQDVAFLRRFDLIWASPPCQFATVLQRTGQMRPDHPNLIPATRAGLVASGRPYILENVAGARRHLQNAIMLCGTQFGLRVYRHRYFESNYLLLAPPHLPHRERVTKCGRRPEPGAMMSIAGKFIGAAEGGRAMGIAGMTGRGLAEAIPPAYSLYLARQLSALFTQEGAA